jgi:hypothetical protein
LKELFNEPDVDMKYIVEDLLLSNGFSIVGAKPKVGKSTFARQLSLCVASGEPFLSKKTTQGSVFYLALEEIRGQVKSHFSTMGATGEEKIFSHISRAPKDAMNQLYKIAKKEKPALIIIDPLFRFVRVKDTNNYGGVTSALEPFSAMAKEALRARKVAGVKLGRPRGVGKSKLDVFKEEIIALLRNGSSKKFVADRYGTSQVNLYNWLNNNNLNVTCQKASV